MREMLKPERKLGEGWARNVFIVSVTFSLFMGFIGPFGDYSVVPFEKRVMVWLAIGLSGSFIYGAWLVILDRCAPGIAWNWRLLITGLVAPVMLTPIVSWLDRLIAGDETGDWLGTFAIVLPVGAVYLGLFELVRILLDRKKLSEEIASQASVEPTGPHPFTGRLPKGLSGELLCLAKEDHYLRVYTDQGDDLIRLRMSDAMRELADLPGLQTHRSWWVADLAVVKADRKASGGGTVTLSNGLTAPISRARLPEAQARGWFER